MMRRACTRTHTERHSVQRRAERPHRRGAVFPLGYVYGSGQRWRSAALRRVLGGRLGSVCTHTRHLDTRPLPVQYNQDMVKRKRPTVCVTISPENLEALDQLQATIPGTTRSGIVDELLTLALPSFQEIAVLIEATRTESGDLDTARARDALAMWTGQQVLKFTEPDDEGGSGG